MTDWASNPGVVSKALSGEAVASEAEFRCQHIQCDSGSRVRSVFVHGHAAVQLTQASAVTTEISFTYVYFHSYKHVLPV